MEEDNQDDDGWYSCPEALVQPQDPSTVQDDCLPALGCATGDTFFSWPLAPACPQCWGRGGSGELVEEVLWEE